MDTRLSLRPCEGVPSQVGTLRSQIHLTCANLSGELLEARCARDLFDRPQVSCGVMQLPAFVEGNCVRPLLILALSCMMAACANSQVVRVVVTPVVWDTTDPRLASELREALARAQPRLRVIAKDWTEAMFQIGSDTLSSSGLYEVGRLLRADWVIGVHACPHPAPCETVLISRVVWPLSPDTVTFHGAEWVGSATDTLSRRLSQKPPGP